MTVIFSKRTGSIQAVFSGDLQHIDTLYGTEAEDFKLIWDEIQVPDDVNVINNPKNYKVNTELRQLEILPEAVQYPIAQV